jgi:hypothetical protein
VSILNPAAMLTMAWGGEISYDQPMPNDPSRLGRLQRGEFDASSTKATPT